jgi:hypothetical protein
MFEVVFARIWRDISSDHPIRTFAKEQPLRPVRRPLIESTTSCIVRNETLDISMGKITLLKH